MKGSNATVLVAWLSLASIVSAPYLVATFDPPPGRVFVGTFHWIDDYSNYVAFAQQAEDGRFLFENKLELSAHDGALINLEWWLVGLLSRVLGRRPFLAFRLLALLVLIGLFTSVDRELRRGGLPASARLPALLLVGFGGGLGGLLFEYTVRPLWRCADLTIGFFPFFEALTNPHWLAGTWLLFESLAAFSRTGSRRHELRGILLGTVVGLTRPHDLALLTLVHGVAVLVSKRPRAWARALLPLAGLLPAIAYVYWVFLVTPLFGTFSDTAYRQPPRADMLLALGPALVLALLGARWGAGAAAPQLRLRLWLWAALGAVIGLSQTSTFAGQFVVGTGLPLLVLAAWALGRLPQRHSFFVAIAFATSAVVAVRIVLIPDPHWHVPAERRGVALALRSSCRPGEIALTPEDIGVYVMSLTSCKPFVSHHIAPDHQFRSAVMRRLYGPLAPEERSAALERLRIDYVALPGDAGPAPISWLGEGSRFARLAVVGEGARAISVYGRTPRHRSGSPEPSHAR